MAPALFVILPQPQRDNWQASLPQHIQDQLAASSLKLSLSSTIGKNELGHIFIAMLADCHPEEMTLCNQHEEAEKGYLSAWATLACPWPQFLESDARCNSIPLNQLAGDLTAKDLLDACLTGMSLLSSQLSTIQHKSRQHVKAGATRGRRWKHLADSISRVRESMMMSDPGSASSSHNVTAQKVLAPGLMCDLDGFFKNTISSLKMNSNTGQQQLTFCCRRDRFHMVLRFVQDLHEQVFMEQMLF